MNLFSTFLLILNICATSGQDSMISTVNQTTQGPKPAPFSADTTRNEKPISIQHVVIDSIRWSPNARIISSNQSTYKIFTDSFSALLTPLIAIITVIIAIQQYRTNKLQLQIQHRTNSLQLQIQRYERRLKIYEALRQFIGSAVRGDGLVNEELFTFIRSTSESSFLFNDEVTKYLQEVYRKGVDYSYVYKRLHNSSSSFSEEKRQELIDKDHELGIWFSKQFEFAESLFRAHMKLVEEQ